MNIQTDRAFVPADSTVVRHLLVQITAPVRQKEVARPPVEVALVLDRSGSMGGSKIELAKRAAAHAIRLLNPTDSLAVVCYDSEVDTLLEKTAAGPEAKALAMSRLDAIDARGQTDLHGGWRRGADLLKGDQHDNDVVRRVLLLSDGQANQGETDPEALAVYAAALRAAGIATSTFGLGADFDEQLMSQIAMHGGGNFYFIEQPAQIPDFFASEIGETLDVVAREARLVLSGGPNVQFACLNQFPTQPTQHGGVVIQLGDLVSGQQVSVVIAVRCIVSAGDKEVPITARVTDRDSALFDQPMPIEWRVVDGEADATQPVSVEVLVAVATLLAQAAQKQALRANGMGDFASAERLLREAAVAIRALAPGVPQVQAVAATLDEEKVYFQTVMSQQQRKQRHFQSHNVMASRTTEGRSRRQP